MLAEQFTKDQIRRVSQLPGIVTAPFICSEHMSGLNT